MHRGNAAWLNYRAERDPLQQLSWARWLLALSTSFTRPFSATSVGGALPQFVLQTIAVGALGTKAREGGIRTAAIGLCLHFFIAFIASAIYYGASRVFPFMVKRAIISGLAYGLCVYMVMTCVVLPLSAFSYQVVSLGLSLGRINRRSFHSYVWHRLADRTLC